ncbi:Crp/Fnr family transcriptional regulator [Kaistia algarum]|uniref:Crp/Fnr family transcriptional regulator n=1 Tax=Kaistia algarum TaxID=2083279 RepID=UPI0014030C47|nr:cyclic nucleotide-binding domain-containing protein [Kaistia algarum]MCX5511901.1 cyclic nucleotide-binding domain-containing protein [Kaistia algarum]
MSTFDLVANSLVHVAALLSVAAMFFKSQLLLRAFLLAGTLLNAVYFFVVPPEVLWGPVFWSIVMFVVNGAMIGLLVLDRTMFGLSEDEVGLFRTFGIFTPGEYRRLMRLANWREAGEVENLTVRGAPVERLYYVLSGDVRVAKAHSVFPVAAGTFIGEVAFLRGTAASASVTVSSGSRFVAWDRKALMALVEKRPAIGIALGSLLNADLAGKVAADSGQPATGALALA